MGGFPQPSGFLGLIEDAGNIALPVDRRGRQRDEVHHVPLLAGLLQLTGRVGPEGDDLDEDLFAAARNSTSPGPPAFPGSTATPSPRKEPIAASRAWVRACVSRWVVRSLRVSRRTVSKPCTCSCTNSWRLAHQRTDSTYAPARRPGARASAGEEPPEAGDAGTTWDEIGLERPVEPARTEERRQVIRRPPRHLLALVSQVIRPFGVAKPCSPVQEPLPAADRTQLPQHPRHQSSRTSDTVTERFSSGASRPPGRTQSAARFSTPQQICPPSCRASR